MPITQTHDLHKRRLGRNIGVALSLVGFAAIVFGLTVAKIREGASMEAFHHQPRVSITPPVDGALTRPHRDHVAPATEAEE